MKSPSISVDEFVSREFDYLIIGGGTAGLCIAARLSEDPDATVGVLEAGGASFGEAAIDVPGRYGEGIGTAYDWQYETTPQSGLAGRKLPWPRGKVLGGTSALNFMTWNRPNREDLDAWAELGNAGWSWDDLLYSPFYQKAERFCPPSAEDATQHRLIYDRQATGTDGPLTISYCKEYSPSHHLWHDTLNGLNVKTNGRHLSGSNVGAWTNIVAVDPTDMTRTYSATAYFRPNASRKNLVLLTEATVSKITLEQTGLEWVARGVEFQHDGNEYAVMTSKEVIMCAGSVASSQLLELSGIGNPAILEQAAIPVKIANPNVGEHLQDHIMTATIYEIDSSIQTPDIFKRDPVAAAMADEIYETKRGGPRTILPNSLCYVPLTEFVESERLASLAKQMGTSNPRDIARARRIQQAQRLGQIEYIFDVGNWSTSMPVDPDSGKAYATLLQILQYPFSVGSIHIDPAAPTGKPIIDPQYYSGKQGALDLEVQQLCAHFGQRILETPPLRDFVKNRVWPPAGVDEAELRDWIVNNTVTDWHPVGTCSMGGREGIKAGVVDERLRVYGVRGLRVADASIMPLQISAHLQATVYAIAEKASAMIKEDRRSRGQ